MSKMRGRGAKLGFSRIRTGESKYKGNCVPNAIAQATGLAFMWVERMLLDEAPKKGDGYGRKAWGPVIERLGFVEIVSAKGKLLDQLPLDDGVWYLACVRAHMIAVRDGVQYDTHNATRKRRKRIVWLYRLDADNSWRNRQGST